jgi:hypothetical protein
MERASHVLFAAYGSLALLIQVLLAACPAQAVSLRTGDIVVSDNETDRVIKVNPVFGDQKEMLCDIEGINPQGLAIDDVGATFVVSVPDGPAPANTGEVIRIVDAGCRSVSVGGDLFQPDDVAIGIDGRLLVNSLRCASCDATEPPAIIAIDPISGAQTPFAFGGLLVDPEDMVVAASGDIFVADDGCAICQPPIPASVIRVSAGGAQQFVSIGGLLGNVSGIEMESSGTLLVVDRGCSSCAPIVPASLLRIDLTAPPQANQTLVSVAPQALDYDGVALGSGDEILVGVENDLLDTGGVGEIGPGGALTFITSGLQLDDVDGIAVAVLLPEPSAHLMAAVGVLAIAVLAITRPRRTKATLEPV